MDTLLYIALGIVAVLLLCAAGVHTLLAFVKQVDLWQRNRARKKLGLPPLSGVYRW